MSQTGHVREDYCFSMTSVAHGLESLGVDELHEH